MVKDPALDAGLVPHKALYDMSLVASHSGSQLANVSGQMFYDWSSTCDAWISNHRFNVVYEYADTPSMRVTSDFAIYEDFTDESMDFTSLRRRNGRLYEEIRGKAELGDKNQAVFTQPYDLDYDLPKGTKLPMAHTIGLLDHIRAGKKIYNAVMFDGSDTEGPVEINAIIGKKAQIIEVSEVKTGLDQGLLQSPAWHVRLAFFPVDEREGTPKYEMSVVFHENGIIREMVIEYDDFSIAQNLVALEALPVPCGDEKEGK